MKEAIRNLVIFSFVLFEIILLLGFRSCLLFGSDTSFSVKADSSSRLISDSDTIITSVNNVHLQLAIDYIYRSILSSSFPPINHELDVTLYAKSFSDDENFTLKSIKIIDTNNHTVFYERYEDQISLVYQSTTTNKFVYCIVKEIEVPAKLLRLSNKKQFIVEIEIETQKGEGRITETVSFIVLTKKYIGPLLVSD